MSTVEKLDRLIADQLQAALPSAVIGRQIVVLEQTGSTNDAILQVASPQGAAVSSLPAVALAKEGPPSLVDEGLVFSPNIKPPGAVSEGTAGNQPREKVFGFQSCYDPRSSSTTRDGSRFGRSKPSRT